MKYFIYYLILASALAPSHFSTRSIPKIYSDSLIRKVTYQQAKDYHSLYSCVVYIFYILKDFEDAPLRKAEHLVDFIKQTPPIVKYLLQDTIEIFAKRLKTIVEEDLYYLSLGLQHDISPYIGSEAYTLARIKDVKRCFQKWNERKIEWAI